MVAEMAVNIGRRHLSSPGAKSVGLHVIGFGALNLDEFWEVSPDFLRRHGLKVGEECVRDEEWFHQVYPALEAEADLKAVDPGGSAANAISALHRMGLQTGFYGVTGEDGAQSLRLEELGRLEDLCIRISSRPAGRCLALIDKTDPHRDRSLVLLPNANDLAGAHRPDPAYFRQARWVHMTSFVSPRCLHTQIEVARSLESNTNLSFDPGEVYCRRGLNELRPILAQTDELFITESELRLLTSEPRLQGALGILFEIGVATVIVKMGGKGIMAFQHNTLSYRPAVEPAVIRDRTGAGDVAAAGFIFGALMEMELDACLEIAALCASRSIEGYGRDAYPDRTVVEDHLSNKADKPS